MCTSKRIAARFNLKFQARNHVGRRATTAERATKLVCGDINKSNRIARPRYHLFLAWSVVLPPRQISCRVGAVLPHLCGQEADNRRSGGGGGGGERERAVRNWVEKRKCALHSSVRSSSSLGISIYKNAMPKTSCKRTSPVLNRVFFQIENSPHMLASTQGYMDENSPSHTQLYPPTPTQPNPQALDSA